MTIFLMSSPCNKSLPLSAWSFICLWYSWAFHPTATSFHLVWHFLCFTTMVHFISLIPHTYCRDPSTEFAFIPSHLRSSTRFRSRPSSFQSLNHASYLSHLCFFYLSPPICWRHTTLHMFCSYKFIIRHKQHSVHYHSHLILDVVKRWMRWRKRRYGWA